MSHFPPEAADLEPLRRRITLQAQNLHPDSVDDWSIDADALREAMASTLRCVGHIRGACGRFDPWVGGHHATLLYFLARKLAAAGNRHDATRIFLTNKSLHGIDLFHEVDLGPVFAIAHTVGMVFAKADYGPRCVFHQGCTVGRDGERRPSLGEGVVMYPHASIIGRCRVGANTVLAPGVQLVNMDAPGDCIVFTGQAGRPVFKPTKERHADRFLLPMQTAPDSVRDH